MLLKPPAYSCLGNKEVVEAGSAAARQACLCVPIAIGFTTWSPLCRHCECLCVGLKNREGGKDLQIICRSVQIIPGAHLWSGNRQNCIQLQRGGLQTWDDRRVVFQQA